MTRIARSFLLALALFPMTASAAERLKLEGCTTVIDFMPAPSRPESGTILADAAARLLAERKDIALHDRQDVQAFLTSQQMRIPSRHDPASIAAIGALIGTQQVLDGIVFDYTDLSADSDQAVVEVSLRLLDVKSQRIVWEGAGRATGSAVRLRAEPISKVVERAVKAALASLKVETQGAVEPCPAIGAVPLVKATPRTAIVVQAPVATPSAAVPVIVKYIGKTGTEQTFDIAESRTLYFNAGVSTIAAPMQDFVDEIAAVLQHNPDLRLILQGHSDSAPGAGPDSNFQLSMKRVLAVYEGLRKREIAPSRILIQSFGDTAPAAPNDSKMNMTLNRRVEFRFLVGDVPVAGGISASPK